MLNPAKSQLGKVAKLFLSDAVNVIKTKTKFNLWKSTKEAIMWFKGLDNKESLTFIQFDINSFYPNISKKLLVNAIEYARKFTPITNLQKKTIIQSCRSLLVSKGVPWVKKGSDEFDVTMGSFSGAEVCEMVGLYLLSQITQHVPSHWVGLYRDDGIIVTNARPRQADILKKKICKLFRENGLSIEANANIKVMNFLDVTFDLQRGIFKPYRKPNDTTNYVHSKSNHPPSILKNIPKNVNKRLSSISANKEVFDEAALAKGGAEKIPYKMEVH